MRIGGGNISKKDEIFEFLQVFFRPFFLLCGGRFEPRRLIWSIHDLEMNRMKKKIQEKKSLESLEEEVE